ncbi:MAG: hypothetical protein ACOY9Y_10990 [Bacillota bacterium]
MLYLMWVRHNLSPGEFWSKPMGEQKLLLAFIDLEAEEIEMARKEVANK